MMRRGIVAGFGFDGDGGATRFIFNEAPAGTSTLVMAGMRGRDVKELVVDTSYAEQHGREEEEGE
jgi:hypothetical protein